MGRYTIHVVGESFRNSDGTDRQSEIGRCRVSEPVTLEREPDNPYDVNCVKVISMRGVQIGNIGRDNAEWIAERMDRGGSIAATIDQIGTAANGQLGVILTLSTDDAPEPANATSAATAVPSSTPAKGGCGKWVLIGAAVLIVLIVLATMIGPPPPSARPDAASGQASTGSVPAQEPESGSRLSLNRISADEFARIQEGMTYSEVVAIVGEPGEEISSSNMAGYTTKMYSWQNFDGSNANVMVQNGRVVMKAQFGL